MGLRFPPSGFTDRTAARAGVRYASWLRRFAAAALDALLVLSINYVALTLYAITIGGLASSTVVDYVVAGLASSTAVLYNTLCLAKLEGQTPGMRFLQVRCTPLGSRRRITIPQALTRSLCGAVFVFSIPFDFLLPQPAGAVRAVVLAVILVSWAWPLVDLRRQTWWDHLAATIVLDDRGW